MEWRLVRVYKLSILYTHSYYCLHLLSNLRKILIVCSVFRTLKASEYSIKLLNSPRWNRNTDLIRYVWFLTDNICYGDTKRLNAIVMINESSFQYLNFCFISTSVSLYDDTILSHTQTFLQRYEERKLFNGKYSKWWFEENEVLKYELLMLKL